MDSSRQRGASGAPDDLYTDHGSSHADQEIKADKVST